MTVEVIINIGAKQDLPEIIGASYDKVLDLLNEEVHRKIIKNGLKYHDTMGRFHINHHKKMLNRLGEE